MRVVKLSEMYDSPTLINLYSNENSQEFPYSPFVVIFDRCVGSCNSLNDLSNKVCVPSLYHVNVNVNLTEQNVIQINGAITINVHVSVINMCMWKRLCLESCNM